MISTAARRAALACTRRSIASSSRGIVSICINHQSLNRMTEDDMHTPNKQIIVSSRPILSTQRRLSSNLPYHIVVGMPALSPTMESGTISKWNVGTGDSFSAGDSLAVIETDKATIDFEAQDDGVVAKILVPAGSGELNVGSPIMVTVDDAADVAAFENFSPEAGGGAPVAAAPAAPEPAVAAPATPAEDLPYHLVVGMPALSPTMDAGTISKWNVSERDSFAAGDSIAVIETDKASMDFGEFYLEC
jgi:pyruvate dehydrogenase E2 component (dihydrolipoamide acetyltransferase)